MTLAWRLVKKQHAAGAFDGQGPRRYPGRWNQKGQAMVYLADSLALAALESLVHMGPEGAWLDFTFFTVRIPDKLEIARLTPGQLPEQWRQGPPGAASQELGAAWLRAGRTAVLRVPSVVMPLGYGFNYLLNPGHPDAAKLSIEDPQPFSFDPRLFAK